MIARRFEAPAANRGVLSEPAFDEFPQLIEDNRRNLNRADAIVGGLPLRELRMLARREVPAAAREYLSERGEDGSCFSTGSPDAPLLLAGHQPELSHPGVWVKHFALNGLARRVGGIPLNLVVDNDTLKQTALRFPAGSLADPNAVHYRSVPFDRFEGEEPYETRTVRDPEQFRSFPERAAPLWKDWGFEPLLPRVWADLVSHPAETIGEKFAGVRRKYERTWGCRNLELPVSWLCRSESFRHFVRHVLGDLPRFRDVYNAALAEYRRRNRIRSRNHPAPDLGPAEAPFWNQSADGRRGRATAKSDPATVRPRALTLTLFARVCLGDFFIHGIGGGKYDEVTDAIICNYFGLEPPTFQVLSATLHLPLPAFPTTAAEVCELARRERDLHWNPQRHLGDMVGRPEAALIRRHHELQTVEPQDRLGRRERYHEFRQIGDRLRSLLAQEETEVHRDRTRLEQALAVNTILKRRDYAWVLYPEFELRPFLQGILN